MVKLISSITAWNDAVGKRLSITYSEVDEKEGKVISDNQRIDRIVVNPDDQKLINDILSLGQEFIDAE